MGPPPPEQAPRPRPEVNTGRPRGWMGSRSCRGEVGVTGRRRAEQRARGDGREDKVSESRAAQAASCAWRKVGTASRGGGSCGGEGPPSLSLPGEGGPAPAATASLSAPCPISSYGLPASRRLSRPRLSPPECEVGGGGVVEGGSTTDSPHIHPLPAMETCPAWPPGAPRPLCLLYLGYFAFVICVQARS